MITAFFLYLSMKKAIITINQISYNRIEIELSKGGIDNKKVLAAISQLARTLTGQLDVNVVVKVKNVFK